MKLDEAQLSEQEALRRKLQQEQDVLQKFQESQEAKLLVQHEKEKQALDEKVATSKLELEKQVSEFNFVYMYCAVWKADVWLSYQNSLTEYVLVI